MDPTQDYLDAMDAYWEARREHDEAQKAADPYGWGYYGEHYRRNVADAREKVRRAFGRAVRDALAQRKLEEADDE